MCDVCINLFTAFNVTSTLHSIYTVHYTHTHTLLKNQEGKNEIIAYGKRVSLRNYCHDEVSSFCFHLVEVRVTWRSEMYTRANKTYRYMHGIHRYLPAYTSHIGLNSEKKKRVCGEHSVTKRTLSCLFKLISSIRMHFIKKLNNQNPECSENHLFKAIQFWWTTVWHFRYMRFQFTLT